MTKQDEEVVKFKPAGKNDNFEIAVMDVNNIVENKKIKLKANNSAKVTDLSTELAEGMLIKAYEGGKNETKISQER